MTEREPQVKPQEKSSKPPRVDLPDIDDLIDRRQDDEISARNYNPWDDPEDLTTYMEPYQNDY